MALRGEYLISDNGNTYTPAQYHTTFRSALDALGIIGKTPHGCDIPLKAYWTAQVQTVAASI